MLEHEAAAKKANDPELWNEIWKSSNQAEWRAKALAAIYDRIEYLLPSKAEVIDIGGGVGTLAKQLLDSKKAIKPTVWEHNDQACLECTNKGVNSTKIDLESSNYEELFSPSLDKVIVGTEVFEHLSQEARKRILEYAAKCHSAMFSIPNNCLGPDEESQHTIQYTAVQFKNELLKHFSHARVEVYGHYMLGVCGTIAKKEFSLAVTMPVRDEAADIEKTLASFRGIADQLIIGIDPRTKDNTAEIAASYTDEVFYIDSPEGPPDEYQGENKMHFSWCRNQCIDRCKTDWVFMCEGHEYLANGVDLLLNLDKIIPDHAAVGMVAREGEGQRWGFPWLFRKSPDIKFIRPVHNTLEFPEKVFVIHLPQIVTKHERDHHRAKERAKQRKAQNRLTLMEDWFSRGSTHSLFYLAQEWREYDPRRSIERFEQLLHTTNAGSQKYQARLILAKEYMHKNEPQKARETLTAAVGDDWARTEHWIWLGDIAILQEKYEEAYTFYKYATTKVGDMPFTLWWIDVCNYTYLPAQRMAIACGMLGKYEEGCHWAKKVAELLPSDCPEEVVKEANENICIFEEALKNAKPN
jgi:2-polyprenyl-3-methyl-5-hydroxy-6-metoxy-1,4-benzoquinol methylase/tetratricopeptide (TPR) repeat protein